VPRLRQAPDGDKEGGSQPTDISLINRRHYWLRLFQWTYYKDKENAKKSVARS